MFETDDLNEYIAMALSLGGLACLIMASMVKSRTMGKVLAFVFLGNLFMAISYQFEGNGNGAVCCYIGAAQSLVNFFFQKKGKSLPIWLVVLYAAAIIAANAVVLEGFIDILAIIASLAFIMAIGQNNSAKYRFWKIVNMLLWSTYDVIKGSYAPLLTHVALLLFTVLGKLILDIKRK